MHSSWEAQYVASRSSVEREPVSVTIALRGLRIDRPELAPEWWEYREIRVVPGVHGGDVKVERASGQSLIIADGAFVEAVRQHAPHADLGGGRPQDGRRKRDKSLFERHPILSMAVGTLVLGSTVYFWMLPAMAGYFAARVPLDWEVDVGNAVVDGITADATMCDDPQLNDAVDGIVSRLAAAIPDTRYTFRVSVVDDTLVNALAAPGGRILVFRGLIQESDTPEELAGVLAHEMQHVELRHGTRAVLRALPLQAIAATLGGSGEAAAAVGVLGSLSYARDDEAEADREGMRLLFAARVDPQGMIDFFEQLGADEEPGSPMLTYLSTHPPTAERRTALQELAATSSTTPTPLFDDAGAWSAVTQRCRAT